MLFVAKINTILCAVHSGIFTAIEHFKIEIRDIQGELYNINLDYILLQQVMQHFGAQRDIGRLSPCCI